MKRNEIIGEHKKGVRAVKYNAKPQTHIEPPKPNNPVAKNANAAIGGGAAGAHKNEKKASQSVRGQKHKNADLAEVSLGNYYTKATKDRAMSGMSAAFAGSPEDREKHKARFDRRDRGLNRLKDRNEKARKAEQEKQLADLVARLPELRAEYEQMKDEYKSLGGSNWQYADREQNLTDYERKARSMEGPMNNLWRQIQAAEKAQREQGVAEEIGYDEVDSKSASYILRKLDNGVSLSDLIDDFPELSRMIDDIAGERGLHADDDFEEIEDILRNDLEDIASQDDDFGDSMDDEDDFDEATGDAVGTISSATPDGKVKIKTATGSEIETNKDALIPGASGTLQMKPDAAGDALKPGAKVVSTEGATEEDMLSHRADSASPISGDEDHDEMSKLLVMRLKRLAGL